MTPAPWTKGLFRLGGEEEAITGSASSFSEEDLVMNPQLRPKPAIDGPDVTQIHTNAAAVTAGRVDSHPGTIRGFRIFHPIQGTRGTKGRTHLAAVTDPGVYGQAIGCKTPSPFLSFSVAQPVERLQKGHRCLCPIFRVGLLEG